MSPSPSRAVLASGRPQISAGGGGGGSPAVMTAGDMHFSATSVTLTGSEVATFIDLNDAANTLAAGASNRPAQPATDSALNNQLSATFASDTVVSGQALSSWAFLHNGTGYESFMVFVPTSITGTHSWMYTGAAPGMDHGMDAGFFYHAIFEGSGGAIVYSGNQTIGLTVGTATYINHSYSTAAGWVLRRRGTTIASGSQAGAPSASAPVTAFAVGSDGFNRANFRLGSLLIFKRVLSSGDRTTVQNWIQSTYGIAP